MGNLVSGTITIIFFDVKLCYAVTGGLTYSVAILSDLIL
jgi:hypothetical protein